MSSRLAVLSGWIPDVMIVAGIGAIAYGAAQVYAPAGWIVGGGFAFGFGLVAARRGGD
jgi:hypothetical protein